jgi:large subunit ribosomal protein L15
MTHGRGKKGGRGAGLRGGRGNAGLCKHKFMYMNKYMPDHYGSHGFKRPQSVIKKDKIINVGQLEELFPGEIDIDLTKEGYDKLLGGGNIKTKIKIKVDSASEKAVAKIEEKGGEVLLPEEKIVEQISEKSGEEKSEEVLEEKTDDKKD